jgi:hypothetical protein
MFFFHQRKNLETVVTIHALHELRKDGHNESIT